MLGTKLKFWILFLTLSSMIRATNGALTDPLHIQLCKEFDQALKGKSPYPGSFDFSNHATVDDILTKQNLIKRMAGTKEDCEKGLEVVWAASNRNEFTQQLFRVLMLNNNFRISFDYSDLKTKAATSLSGYDLFKIFINANEPSAESSAVHECIHLLENFIISDFIFDIYPMTIMKNEQNDIFKSVNDINFDELVKKWDANFEHLLIIYDRKLRNLKLTPEEDKLLNEIIQSMEKEKTVYHTAGVSTDQSSKYILNSKYSLSKFLAQLKYLQMYDDLTIVKIIDSPDLDGKFLYLAGRNNFETLIITYLHYRQIGSNNYPKNQFNSELIARIIQDASMVYLKAIYAELISTLMHYMEQLLIKYNHNELYNTNDDAANYRLLYKLQPHWAFRTPEGRIAINNTVFNLIDDKLAKKDTINTAIVTLQYMRAEDSYKKNRNVPAAELTIDNLLLAELYYIRGELKSAIDMYHRADKAFTKIAHANNDKSSKTVFDHSPGSLQRYNAALKMNNDDPRNSFKTMRTSLQRKLKRI